jgi:hypothetical protein
VRLADPGRPEQDHIARVVEEAQRLELADLALVNAGLKAEVELVEGLLVGQVGEAHAGA